MLYPHQRFTADLLNDYLPGIDAWTDYGSPSVLWTATGSNPTIGNGSIVARYKLLDGPLGKTCAFRIKVTVGSTTSIGSGDYKFRLPFNVADEQVATALFRDNSGAVQFAATAWLQSGNEIHSVNNASGTRWANNQPVTWATGDRAEISGVYEIA